MGTAEADAISRIDSLDWQFSNVTADSTYQFVGPWSGLDEEHLAETKVFEMRGMHGSTQWKKRVR